MSKAATATPAAGKGILKIVPVSQSLAKFAGESELSRASAVKKVWEYIKGQNLQVWDFYSVISVCSAVSGLLLSLYLSLLVYALEELVFVSSDFRIVRERTSTCKQIS